jgi:hypothetical protein
MSCVVDCGFATACNVFGDKALEFDRKGVSGVIDHLSAMGDMEIVESGFEEGGE